MIVPAGHVEPRAVGRRDVEAVLICRSRDVDAVMSLGLSLPLSLSLYIYIYIYNMS